MANKTANYNLTKPLQIEDYNVDVQNGNMDIIDENLKLLATQSYDMGKDQIYYCGATSGTNAYTVTNSKIAAYADGLTVRIKIGTASTGASTLNINGLGAKAIFDTLGNPIVSGGLKAGLPYQLCYNGTNFIVLGKGGGGNAIASQLLKDKTATTDLGQIVGTIPSKAAATITPSTSTQTIAVGQYLSGAQTISATTGTATVADVVAGKTFNSANGIGLTGTASVESLGGYKIATGTAVPDKTSNSNVVCSTIVFPFKNVKFFACTGSGTAYNGDATHTGLSYTCLYNDAVGMYVWYEGYSALTSSIWDPSKIIICKPSLSPIKSTTGSFTWIAVGN